MELRGKVAIVTGASTGIGRSVALKLAEKGAKLALVSRRRDVLEELASSLSDRTEAIAVAADVSDETAVKAAVELVVEHFGHLNLLINNAGVAYFGPIERLNMEAFDRMVRTNVYGLIHMTKAALPYLKKTEGMVVNVSSGMSKRALPFLATYAGTKAFVDAISDGLRLEVKPYGVKVVNFGPPETKSDFQTSAYLDPEFPMPSTERRKFATSEEVAARMIVAIEKEEREVMMSKSLARMNFFAPRLVDRMFYKMMVERMIGGK